MKVTGNFENRREYWAIAACEDEVEFHLSNAGVVKVRINCGEEKELMHVDVSVPLWPVLDV